MTELTKPTLTVTAFEGTSLEQTLSTEMNFQSEDPLRDALKDLAKQYDELSGAAALDLHIAALEKSLGKKLTKAQRELVQLSFELSGPETGETPEPKQVVQDSANDEPEPTAEPEQAQTEPEQASVEEPKPSEEPPQSAEDVVQETVKEMEAEQGKDVDDATAKALADLGL